MELSQYFDPIGLPNFQERFTQHPQSLGSLSEVYTLTFPDYDAAEIVLFGVEDERGATGREGASEAPDLIRSYLYQLAAPLSTVKIADLGNLVIPEDRNQLFKDIAEITAHLLRLGKIVVMLGGTQDIVYGQYLGFQPLEMDVNYITVDSSPDILDPEAGVHHHSYNNIILTHSPNYLRSFANLAAQTYFVTEGERKALKSLNFETLRIGDIHADLTLAEPYLRDAHIVGFDLAAVRHSEAPGTNHPSPAGLSVEEACQLARFAGMGYNTQAVSFCEVNPQTDVRNMTSHLTALMIWYFIEGVYNRMDDRPSADRSNVIKYVARLEGPVKEIQFFKSRTTGRWWMEVPSPETLNRRGSQFELVPCAYRDYQLAQENEIPERWWVAHYRFTETL
ncbi:MAG: formimidoylglutamase [Bacteroidota bacterium]